MGRFKIILMALVLFGGVSGSYLIINNSTSAVKNQGMGKKESSVLINSSIKKPIQWVKSLSSISNTSEAKESLKNQDKEIFNNSSSIDNYTESIAKSMFDKMKTMDQSGDNPFKDFSINDSENQKLTQQILVDLKNFSIGLSSVKNINIADMKVSQDNSLEAKAKYLENAGKIIINNSNEFYNKPHIAVEKLAVSGNVDDLNQLINAYSNILNSLLSLAVPSDFIDIHQRYLNFLNRTKTFYSEIKVFKNDPIRIQLLVSLVTEIMKEDLDIKQEFYQKFLEINS